MLKLVVTTNIQGDVFELILKRSKIRVGRRRDNDLRIVESYISGYHAELQRDEDGGYDLVDVGSSNGTFLNGKRVTEKAKIKAGDFIKFGILKVAVQRHDGIAALFGVGTAGSEAASGTGGTLGNDGTARSADSATSRVPVSLERRIGPGPEAAPDEEENELAPAKAAKHSRSAEAVKLVEAPRTSKTLAGAKPARASKPNPTDEVALLADPSRPAPEAKVSDPAKVVETAKAPERVKIAEPAKSPEPEKSPERAKSPEPAKAPERAKSHEPAKSPEPAKAMPSPKVVEIAKITEPSKVQQPAEAAEPKAASVQNTAHPDLEALIREKSEFEQRFKQEQRLRSTLELQLTAAIEEQSRLAKSLEEAKDEGARHFVSLQITGDDFSKREKSLKEELQQLRDSEHLQRHELATQLKEAVEHKEELERALEELKQEGASTLVALELANEALSRKESSVSEEITRVKDTERLLRSDLESKVASLVAELTSVREESKILSERTLELDREQVKTLESQNKLRKEHASEINRFVEEVASLREEVAELREKDDRASRDFTEREHDLLAQVGDLTGRLEASEASREALVAELASLRVELDAAQFSYNDYTSKIDEVTAAANLVQTTLAEELRISQENSEQMRETLEAKMISLRTELLAWQERAKALGEETRLTTQDFAETRKRLNDELEQKRKEEKELRQRLESRIVTLTEDLQTSELRVSELSRELRETTSRHIEEEKSYREEIDRKRADEEQLRNAHDDALAQLKKQLRTVQKENKDLAELKRLALTEHDKVQGRLAEEIKRLQNEDSELRSLAASEVHQLQGELAAAREASKRLEERLEKTSAQLAKTERKRVELRNAYQETSSSLNLREAELLALQGELIESERMLKGIQGTGRGAVFNGVAEASAAEVKRSEAALRARIVAETHSKVAAIESELLKSNQAREATEEALHSLEDQLHDRERESDALRAKVEDLEEVISGERRRRLALENRLQMTREGLSEVIYRVRNEPTENNMETPANVL
jgi:FHA domain